MLRQYFAGRRHLLEIGSGTGQHAVYFADAMPWLTWQCSDQVGYLSGIRQWLDEAGLANTPAAVELDVRGTWPTQCFDAVFSANTLHIMGWAEAEAFFAGIDAVLGGPSTSALRAYAQSRPRTRSGDERGERDEGRGSTGSPPTASGILVVYGPFNYGGAYSSDSNREFDGWLKARDPRSGIRDFDAVDALAQAIGLQLVDDIAMPANNRCLVWRRG